MTKIDLQQIGFTDSTSTLINQNSAEIETKSDTFLSRNGATPNEMLADLDMNGNQILNLSAPASGTEPVRLQDLNTIIGGGTIIAGIGRPSPAISTDNAIVRWDGTNAASAQNSGVTISDTNVLANANILSTGSSSARTLETRFAEVLNVKDFGAVGDGAANDTAAIQATIDALPVTGGVVLFPPGNYKVSSLINIGNGSSSTVTTKYGITLRGINKPEPATIPTGFATPASKITWAGGATAIFQVNGPLQGWGFENLYIDGISTAQIGIQAISAQHGENHNVTVVGCRNDGIRLTTYDQAGGLSAVHCDCFHNTFINTNVVVPNVADACGIHLMAASTNSNSDFNSFINTTIAGPGGSTSWQGIILGWADGNTFHNTHVFGGSSAGVGVRFDYGATKGPVNNYFYGIDSGTNSLVPFSNNGSPAAGSNFNYIFGFAETNGAALPYGISNLSIGTFTGGKLAPRSPTFTNSTSYTQLPIENSIVFDSAGTKTITLLSPSTYAGHLLWIKTQSAQLVNSASSNVNLLAGAGLGTAILPATAGKWALLQADGANWDVIASN